MVPVTSYSRCASPLRFFGVRRRASTDPLQRAPLDLSRAAIERFKKTQVNFNISPPSRLSQEIQQDGSVHSVESMQSVIKPTIGELTEQPSRYTAETYPYHDDPGYLPGVTVDTLDPDGRLGLRGFIDEKKGNDETFKGMVLDAKCSINIRKMTRDSGPLTKLVGAIVSRKLEKLGLLLHGCHIVITPTEEVVLIDQGSTDFAASVMGEKRLIGRYIYNYLAVNNNKIDKKSGIFKKDMGADRVDDIAKMFGSLIANADVVMSNDVDLAVFMEQVEKVDQWLINEKRSYDILGDSKGWCNNLDCPENPDPDAELNPGGNCNSFVVFLKQLYFKAINPDEADKRYKEYEEQRVAKFRETSMLPFYLGSKHIAEERKQKVLKSYKRALWFVKGGEKWGKKCVAGLSAFAGFVRFFCHIRRTPVVEESASNLEETMGVNA